MSKSINQEKKKGFKMGDKSKCCNEQLSYHGQCLKCGNFPCHTLEEKECNCGYEEGHGLTCPLYVAKPFPLEEKGKDAPWDTDDIVCGNHDCCPTPAPEKNYICLNTRHRETGLEFPCERCTLAPESKSWETTFEEIWSESHPDHCVAETKLISFISQLIQEEKGKVLEKVWQVAEALKREENWRKIKTNNKGSEIYTAERNEHYNQALDDILHALKIMEE